MGKLERRRGAAGVAALCMLLGGNGGGEEAQWRDLARQAASADEDEAARARARLRASGPRALELLREVHAQALTPAASPADRERAGRVRAALDAVAGQRHAAASGLYWYTDLEQAKAQARQAGRPILSLRLLGRLDEQFSCANSRFFRTVLYANREVAAFLRDHFVLHWSSERPAPRVTIDFGDGRRLEGTLTGNSVHYILDSEGRPVDALPGLYGPRAFLAGLRHAEAAAQGAGRREGTARRAWLRRYHQERLRALAAAWESDLARAGMPLTPRMVVVPPGGGDAPHALAADQLAMAKSRGLERPVLKALFGRLAEGPSPYNAQVWEGLAELHRDDARLDAGALDQMRSDGIEPLTATDTVVAFERAIARDTVYNEYELHSRLHGWFGEGSVGRDLEGLNARVYAELFLTPRTDPWLGLVPPKTYSALGGSAWAGR